MDPELVLPTALTLIPLVHHIHELAPGAPRGIINAQVQEELMTKYWGGRPGDVARPTAAENALEHAAAPWLLAVIDHPAIALPRGTALGGGI